MKRTLQLLSIITATSILSSCGSGGDSISEVNLIPIKNGKEFQYIDKEGNIAINPQFRYATVFRDGLALVMTSGDEPKFGYITEEGKYAINAQYKEATVFSDGLAWVVAEDAAPSAIDKKGEVKFTLQDAEEVRLFKDGFAAFSVVNEEGDEKWGFVDKTGKVVINPQFQSVSNFSDGLCGVKNDNGKWGFINKEGTITISYQFDQANNFKNGKCIVTSSNKDGVIDKKGKYIINPQFSSMQIDGDMFLIKQDGKYGWCDKEGKLIINPQFISAYPFLGNKLTAVELGKSFGYINKDGKIEINPQFDYALPFNGKLAMVGNADKFGFIDKEGKYVINPQFEYDQVSEDFFVYLTTGSTDFYSVNTDYFNVEAIISELNFNNPEGLTFSSTFDDVKNKFALNERNFRKYRDYDNLVLQGKRITNDAIYDFYAVGNAFNQVYVQKSNGWNTYTEIEYQFNEKAKPSFYVYMISLSGKGYGKEDVLISAIKGKLMGYQKDELRSDDDTIVYFNDKNEITIYNGIYRGIRIDVAFKTSEETEVVEDDEDFQETDIKSIEEDVNTEFAQVEDVVEEEVEDVVEEEAEEDIEVPFSVIENVPIFPGCENKNGNEAKKQCMSEKISNYVNSNYNTKLASDLGLTGRQRISVIFKIDENGNISDVRSRAPHPDLEREAARVINELPQMQPGKQSGKSVTVQYSLPIIFQVQD